MRSKKKVLEESKSRQPRKGPRGPTTGVKKLSGNLGLRF